MSVYFFDLSLWWLFFLLLGIVNLPLTARLLPNLSDLGWIFSKILSLSLVSYTTWLLGMTRLAPFTNLTMALLLLALFSVNFYLQRSNKRPWLPGSAALIVLIEELIFTAGFAFWAFIRAHNPDIHDLEKFMDFGFINSILRSQYFPPKDIWLAGGTINYYYFGHLVVATIIKFLGTKPEVGYNLMLSLLFALTLAASFSIGFNLFGGQGLRSRISGLLTAIFLTLFGNLQVIFAFIKGLNSYWYPDATRFIPSTIHELPIYSFIVADLHGHLLDIPIVLLTIIFLYIHFFSAPTEEKPSWKEKEKQREKPNSLAIKGYGKYLFAGWLLALMYMTNAADALIYFGLLGLIILIKNYRGRQNLLTVSYFKDRFLPPMTTLISTLIFSLPFQLSFKPFTEGVKIAPERSPLWMFLIIWSFGLFFLLSFLTFYWKEKSIKTNSDRFIAFLSSFILILIILPELIYFKDIYTTQPRANTMFKFAYQAFMISAIVAAYSLTKFSAIIRQRFSLRGVIWLLVALNLTEIMSLYPYLAITSAYGKDLRQNIRGLDGLRYLAETRPDDYRAIEWINRNIKDQPVILEAVGDSYTDYARISAFTGLPTVLGWPVHEWLWRKDVEVTNTRRREVETVYNGADPLGAKQILQRYNVQYIYWGQLEREKYPELDETRLLSLGDIVYQNATAKIIKVR